MANAVEIYQGQDFYVPTFQVVLLGRPLGKEVIRDITQVTYRDNLKEVDSFEITINNWDAQERRFKYSDEHLFDPGKELELWMGYFGKDPLRLMIKGKIKNLRPTFPASGQPTLAISGANVQHEMRGEQRTHAYLDKDDAEIAAEIGNRVGVQVKTDDIAKREKYQYVFQDTQYDLVFLMERAHKIGCEVVIEEGGSNGRSDQSVLRFIPSDRVRRTTYRLSYGRSLIEFQPELSTANQVNQVEVRGWDAKNKRPINAVARRGRTRAQGLEQRSGEGGIGQSFANRREIIADQPINSQQEAQTTADEAMERVVKDMVKGRGSTVGLPDLRAGCAVVIDGLGTRFDGRYFVDTTTHTIGDSGYTTQFECHME